MRDEELLRNNRQIFLTQINIEGKEYVYSQALVNVQREHSIKTDNEERIMLKFSIKDKSFEEVLNNIKYIVQIYL